MALQVNLQLGGPVPVISIVAAATAPRIPLKVSCPAVPVAPPQTPPPMNYPPSLSPPRYPSFDEDADRQPHDALARAEREFQQQDGACTSPSLSAVSEEGVSPTTFGDSIVSSVSSDVWQYNRTSKSEPHLKRLRNGTQTTFAVADNAQRRAVRLQLAIARTARRWYAAKREADALVDDLQFEREKPEKPFVNRSRYGNRAPKRCDADGDVSPVLMKRKHGSTPKNNSIGAENPRNAAASELKFEESAPEEGGFLTPEESPVNSLVFEEPISAQGVSSSDFKGVAEPVFEEPENHGEQTAMQPEDAAFEKATRSIPVGCASGPDVVESELDASTSRIQCVEPAVAIQPVACEQTETDSPYAVEREVSARAALHELNEESSEQHSVESEAHGRAMVYTTTTTAGANIAPATALRASDIRAQYAAFRDAIGDQVVPLRKEDLRVALLMQPRPPNLSRNVARKPFMCCTQNMPTAELLLSGPAQGELTLWTSGSLLRWAACASVGRRDAAMFHHALNAWSCALEGRVRFKYTDKLADANILVVRGRETRAFFPRRATLHLVTVAEERVEYHELLHHVGHLVGLYHSMHIDAIPPLCSSRRRTAVGDRLGDISMDDVDSLIDAYDTLDDGDQIHGNDLFETITRTIRRVEPDYE